MDRNLVWIYLVRSGDSDMRKYKFEFKSNDDPDFPEHTKFCDKFVSYLDEGETDLDEFVREARQFMKARGYHRNNTDGIVYLKWHYYSKPEYTEEYLVTLKGKEYTTVAKYDVDEGWNIDENNIIAWAEMPIGAGHEC